MSRGIRCGAISLLIGFSSIPAGTLFADNFVFDWWILAGDFGPPSYLDLDGDPVPKKIWGVLGDVSGAPPKDFPEIVAWLGANYGPTQGYQDQLVRFDFGTEDTSLPHAFELDTATFTNDPADGVARMVYIPAGGAPSIPVTFRMGGLDGGGAAVLQVVATGTITAIHLEMNSALGWSGYGEFTVDAEVPALGPETGTQAPFYSEVAALVGGAPPFRVPIIMGEFDPDAEAQMEWETEYPTGQIADATVFGAVGAGYVGERSGSSQGGGDVFLPTNGELPSGDGDWRFTRQNLPRLGAWFDPPLVSEYSYRSGAGTYFSGVGLPTGIDTTDGQFTIWFDGTSAVVDEGVFFSFADHFAGGGNLVNSFRITDIEPEVDAADALAFPVRLAFWDGADPVETASVAIRPAVEYRVDSIIGTRRSIDRGKGDDHYTNNGSRQTVRLRSQRGKSRRAFLHLQNDGEGADRFFLRGPDGNRRFLLQYRAGGNVTGAVARGKYSTAALEPGQSERVKISMIPVKSALRHSRNGGGSQWLRARYRAKIVGSSKSGGNRDAAKILIRHVP